MSALQKGEKILITGGTGWVGTHIANEALAAGLQIRLAIRGEGRADELIKSLRKTYGSSAPIETILVKDFLQSGAFNDAVNGVVGVIHCASDTSFSDDPKQVIDLTVQAYKNILESSAKNPSIRRFVLTSSSVAVGFSNVDEKETVHRDANSWNDAAVEMVKNGVTAPGIVYSASKVESERAAWAFLKEKSPNFTITTINCSANFGLPLPGFKPQSTGSWLVDIAEGRPSTLEAFGPGHHIDVEDVAKLHVIALTREDVKNERILAYGSPFNLNSLIDLIKKLNPDAKTLDKKPEWEGVNNTIHDVSRAQDMLKAQGGLRDLEYSVKRNLGY